MLFFILPCHLPFSYNYSITHSRCIQLQLFTCTGYALYIQIWAFAETCMYLETFQKKYLYNLIIDQESRPIEHLAYWKIVGKLLLSHTTFSATYLVLKFTSMVSSLHSHYCASTGVNYLIDHGRPLEGQLVLFIRCIVGLICLACQHSLVKSCLSSGRIN